MDVDPAASMRCWVVEIKLAGKSFEIAALPAADWWPVISSGDVSLILDGDDTFMSKTDRDAIDDLLIDGDVTGEALSEALIEVVEETAGRSFHAALVLATVAISQWPLINGVMAQRGFRWDIMPLGAALDAVYSIAVNGMDEETRAKFLTLLDNEAMTTGKPTPRQRAKVEDEFAAMAGPRPTAGVKSTGGPSGGGRPRTRQRRQQLPPADRSREPMPRPDSPERSDLVTSSEHP